MHKRTMEGEIAGHEFFSPDGKWIIFRANFEGHSDIYAVEIEKSGKLR